MQIDNLTATRYVQNLNLKGSNYGLERTRALLDLCGSPDEKLKIIHVAGTNGKGSLCAYFTSILLAAGKTVGTFTSPAVYSYEEQFLVNGRASAVLTEKYLAKVIEFSRQMADKPTAFELETCAALLMFSSEGCEYAVVECGLGGLTDATNAVRSKEVAVINSVSLEHTALLGNTVLEIAKQKAGIIKNCPAVVNCLQPPEVLQYFSSIGAIIAGIPQDISTDINDCKFCLNNKSYSVNLCGNYQSYNAATAIKTCEVLGIDEKAVTEGLGSARLGGRIEVINSDKTYILDGAHNPASFLPLADYIRSNFSGKRVSVIYGCLSDKDTDGCLKLLADVCGNIIAVTPKSHRAKPSAEVLSICKKYFAVSAEARSVEDALLVADGDVVAVCGTFTILKEAKEWIGKRL
ncbi:MAG: hypothetical protein LUI60_07375 [Clostridia bacterium]|nr:hypothetical protein [Clostridia bacterium]